MTSKVQKKKGKKKKSIQNMNYKQRKSKKDEHAKKYGTKREQKSAGA